ncbi:hypothetical protein B0J11DRAFT_535396 [Dendryphion nanum]|uniref:Secreted protein n=1 Tax=Dendryphion nanum TaxID=256645 RepID=A0A9P9DH58_9PLEO|nr:hypothetical protein B0J11DRAFT_535396 [Dendryphion nanum]
MLQMLSLLILLAECGWKTCATERICALKVNKANIARGMESDKVGIKAVSDVIDLRSGPTWREIVILECMLYCGK